MTALDMRPADGPTSGPHTEGPTPAMRSPGSADFLQWWCDVRAGEGSVLSRRRRAGLAGVPCPAGPGDWRWCPPVPLPAARLHSACAMLAGIWLGVKASWWTQWPADRRRAALALGSTAPFTPRWAGSRDRALADAAHAPLWAWQELSLLLRQALPALEQRLHAEWRPAVGADAPAASSPCERLPTQAELSRARRQWLAAVRGV